MSSNTENIEAKLAAYVDGDLDELGKVEIEKHLQANPQHRLLLEELKQTKFMLQALPRENAPLELSETIHGQLERSVLLDGVGTTDAGATMKINRWPQMMAVAAVLLLASGLGILVYVVLPKHADTTIAIKETPSAPAVVAEDDKLSKDARLESKASEELGKVGAKADDVFAKDKTAAPSLTDEQPGDGFARSDVAKKGGSKELGEAAPNLTIAGGVDSSPPATPEPAAKPQGDLLANASPRRVYVVLSTDNLATTNGQVANYLDTNKIAWSQADASVQNAFASRLNRTEMNVGNRENPFNGNRDNNFNVGNATTNTKGNYYNNDNYSGGVAVQGKAGASAAKSNDAPRNNDNESRNEQQQLIQRQYDFTMRSRAAGDLTLQQQGGVQQREGIQPQVAAESTPGQGGNVAQAQQLAQQEAAPSNPAENVIIARGLTREQATMVVDSVGKLYAGQTAVVVDRDAIDGLPVTAELNAQAVDAAVTSATTQPATQPVVESERKPTWNEADALAGMDRVFKAPPPSGEPSSTTQPATPAAGELTLTTQPSQPDAPGALVQQALVPPASQPAMNLAAGPATRPTAEPLEVVIVVQATPAANAPAVNEPAAVPPPTVAAPTTASPTTEPAGTIAETPVATPTTQPVSAPADAK